MSVRKVLRALGEYKNGADPHGLMTQVVVDRCRELAAKPSLSSDDIEKFLDDCVRGSLCTNFVVKTLDRLMKELKKVEEGKV